MSTTPTQAEQRALEALRNLQAAQDRLAQARAAEQAATRTRRAAERELAQLEAAFTRMTTGSRR